MLPEERPQSEAVCVEHASFRGINQTETVTEPSVAELPVLARRTSKSPVKPADLPELHGRHR
jgi:hypothetical protein